MDLGKGGGCCVAGPSQHDPVARSTSYAGPWPGPLPPAVSSPLNPSFPAIPLPQEREPAKGPALPPASCAPCP